MLKLKNPDKEYPSNIGQKWTDEEEKLLLEELSKNIDVQIIAQSHNRTIGGITTRLKHIAYKMHSNNDPVEEIILKTKLTEQQIKEIVKKREPPKEIKIQSKMENDIDEIKNEIKDLKNNIKVLTDMIIAIYDFETA
jgi:hypothetical protein